MYVDMYLHIIMNFRNALCCKSGTEYENFYAFLNTEGENQ